MLSLSERLAEALPKDTRFTFYHVSTPPTKCSAIYSPPPGAKPETTYCESNFLSVSISPCDSGNAEKVFAFAIEVLIFTTKHLTTIFISKADSTGYLSLLKVPEGQSSPLRSITSTFVSYLVETRQRPNVKLVVSLFARASDQYLFPGSVENAAKHVSDDRQLIKWWCRVLDPVLRGYPADVTAEIKDDLESKVETGTTAQAYVIVPGEDSIFPFLPVEVRLDASLRKRWKHGHPLHEISAFPSAPPRCLIPHFPDDPKSRLLNDLDEELPDSQTKMTMTDSPSKRGSGKWRSVHTIDQFWLTMEQRSECSSGRLVGFIWIVFTPPNDRDSVADDGQGSKTLPHESNVPAQPPSPLLKAASSRKARSQRKKPLTGVIVPRTPRIKSTSSNPASASLRLPPESKYYTWPPTSRGEIVLEEKNYKKAIELLLRLDFSNRNIAESSTKTWIDELAVLAGREKSGWGREVEGMKVGQVFSKNTNTCNGGGGAMVTMNTMQVKRKSAPLDTHSSTALPGAISSTDAGVNTLQPRKRAKLINVDASNGVGKENNDRSCEAQSIINPKPETTTLSSTLENKEWAQANQVTDASATHAPVVNVLGNGFVRKKPKATI